MKIRLVNKKQYIDLSNIAELAESVSHFEVQGCLNKDSKIKFWDFWRTIGDKKFDLEFEGKSYCVFFVGDCTVIETSKDLFSISFVLEKSIL